MFAYRTIAILLATAAVIQAQPDDAATVDSPRSATSQATSSVFSGRDRFRWAARATLGPKNLGAGVFVAGFQTLRNEPEEYDPHWDGFAKRYGARLVAGATSNMIEAGIGSLWGEDPRYVRAGGQPMSTRIGHVVKMAFVTHNRTGAPQLAYARYVAVPGGILISNTWRPDSQSTIGNVSLQVGLGFLSRIVSNAFSEFMPDVLGRGKQTPLSPSAGSSNASQIQFDRYASPAKH